MAICKYCNQSFLEVKPWQEFCCQRHQQDWHLHQRKLARQERLFDKLIERENGMNGHGTPEERKEASEVLARIVGQQTERKMVRRI
jgi:hypothetical protein